MNRLQGLLLTVLTLSMFSGCSEDTATVSSSSTSPITVDLNSNKATYLINETITLTASTTAPNPTYEWKEGSGAWESGTATKTYTKSSATKYDFSVKMTSGGSSVEKILSVTVTNGSGSEGNLKGDGIPNSRYHKHSNIIASLFWVGEGASDANHNISNKPSAWRGDWSVQYGLEDWALMPRDNAGFPLDSRYKNIENPYYVALPYNDMGALISDEGEIIVKDNAITVDGLEYSRKKSSLTASYWKSEKKWPDYDVSLIKNRWVKITFNGKHCYAQVEDAGPFFYNDTAYVFGTSRPINEQYKTTPQSFDNLGAGIDLSPAVMKYLTGVVDKGQTTVDWQFIDEANVPSGPWAKIITKSQMGGW